MVIKRVSPGSVAKVAFVLYAVIGLVIGACLAVFGFAASSIAALGGGRNSSLPGMFLGVGAVVFLPIVYGVMAAIVSAISAVIYNLVAGWIGGIEIEVA